MWQRRGELPIRRILAGLCTNHLNRAVEGDIYTARLTGPVGNNTLVVIDRVTLPKVPLRPLSFPLIPIARLFRRSRVVSFPVCQNGKTVRRCLIRLKNRAILWCRLSIVINERDRRILNHFNSINNEHFFSQGIDINHKHDRKVRRTEPKSQDVYLRLLVKVDVLPFILFTSNYVFIKQSIYIKLLFGNIY